MPGKINPDNGTYENGTLIEGVKFNGTKDIDKVIVDGVVSWELVVGSFAGLTGATPSSYPSQTVVANQGNVTDPADPDPPTKTGYTFADWDTALPTTILVDTVFTAQWTAHTYTIQYNINGGDSGTTADSSHTYDTPKVLTANGFSRVGYTFAGWATSAGGAVVYSDQQSVTNLSSTNGDTVTLYAKWTAITYTIQYNINGGDSGTTADSTHTYDAAKALTDNGFSRVGYTFAGWAISALSAVVYSDQQPVTNLSSTNGDTVTLYAKWNIITYTIDYNFDPAATTNSPITNPNPPDYTVESAEISLSDASRPGYSWDGWDEVDITIEAGSTGNEIFNGNFSITPYTISYVMNGGTNHVNNPSSYDIEDLLITLSDPSKSLTGYLVSFNSWSPSDNIPSGSTGNKTFTASWNETAITYTISYNANGGTGTTADSTHTYDTAKALTDNGFSRVGYTFAGWATSAGGSVVYSDQQSVTNLSSTNGSTVTLYAKWNIITYTIDYNFDPAATTNSPITNPNPPDYTVESAEISLVAASRPGYTWDGWDEADTTIESGSTGNEIFNGNFLIENYNITYTLNGGTNSGSNPSTYTIEDSTINFENPTKTGYTFVSWSVPSITSGSTGAVTTIASWTINEYTVTFNEDGGSSVTDISQNYDTSVARPADPTKTNYVFDGWYESIGLVNYLSEGISGYNAFNIAYWVHSTTDTGTFVNGNPVFQWITAGESYTYTSDYVLDDNLECLSGQQVTFSMYIRRVEGSATGRIRIYDNVNGYAYQNISATTSFQRFQITKTIGYNPTRIFVMLDNTGGGTYQFHSPMLEIGSSASTFTRSVTWPFNMPEGGRTLYAHWTAEYTAKPTVFLSVDSTGLGITAGITNNDASSVTVTELGGTITNNTGFGLVTTTAIGSGATYQDTSISAVPGTGETFTAKVDNSSEFESAQGSASLSATATPTVAYSSRTGLTLTFNFTGVNGTVYATLNGTQKSRSGNGTITWTGLTPNTEYSTSAVHCINTGEIKSFYATNASGTTLQRYTITYADGAGTGGTTVVYDSGTPAGIVEAGAPTITPPVGYSNNGWTPAWVNVTANKTYTMTFAANSYTITLNPNNGTSGSTTSIDFTYDTSIDAWSSNMNPTRGNYYFNGFYTTTSGGTKWINDDGYNNLTNNTFSSNTTLYAQWTARYTSTPNVTLSVDSTGLVITAAIQNTDATSVTVTALGGDITGNPGFGLTLGTAIGIGGTYQDSSISAFAGQAETFTAKVDNTTEFESAQGSASLSATATPTVAYSSRTGLTLTFNFTGVNGTVYATLNGTQKSRSGNGTITWTGLTANTQYTTSSVYCINTGEIRSSNATNASGTTLQRYTITYADGAGTGGTTTVYDIGTSSSIVAAGAPAITPPTGYSNDGWTPAWVDVTANKTYTMTFAANPYTITLNPNNGTSGSITTINFTYDTSIDAWSSNMNPTRLNYYFNGFYTATSGGTKWINDDGYNNLTNNTFSSNTTLYAQWTARYTGTPNVTLSVDSTGLVITAAIQNTDASSVTVTELGGTITNNTGFGLVTTTAIGSGATYQDTSISAVPGTGETFTAKVDNTTEFESAEGSGSVSATATPTVAYSSRTGLSLTFNFTGVNGTVYATVNGTQKARVGNGTLTWTGLTANTTYNTSAVYCINSGEIRSSNATNASGTTLQRYTITYADGAGTGGTTAVYDSGTPAGIVEAGAPTITPPTGYSNNEWTPAWVNVTANKTYTMTFAANPYTITLNPNGGTSGSTTSIDFTYDTSIDAWSSNMNPTRLNYYFNGFYTATSGGTKWINDDGYNNLTNNTFSSNTTLYAQWTARYTGTPNVTLSVDSTGLVITAGIQNTDATSVTVTELGGTITGNAGFGLTLGTAIGIGGTYQDTSISAVPGTGETFTAKVDNTTEFESAQGSASLSATATPTVAYSSRTGLSLTFNFTGVNGTVYATLNGTQKSRSGNGTITWTGLVANTQYTTSSVYCINSGEIRSSNATNASGTTLQRYTITYADGAGTGGTTTVYDSGTSAAIVEAGAPTITPPTGYSNDGWTPGWVNVTANKTYTMTFAANSYTITLNPNNGTSGSITTINFTYDTSIDAWSSDMEPSRLNYYFDGFWTATSGGTQYIDELGNYLSLTNNTFSSNTTLYAQWTARYTTAPNVNLTVDSTGLVITATVTNTGDEAATISEITGTLVDNTGLGTNIKLNEVLAASTGEREDTPITAIAGSSETLKVRIDSDVEFESAQGIGTIFASSIPTVAYSSRTGTSLTFNFTSVYYGSTVYATVDGTQKSRSDDGTITWYGLTANTTYSTSSVYKIKPSEVRSSNATNASGTTLQQYTVTFKDWDNTTLKTQIVDHGSDATPPTDPTRTGYNFNSWSGTYTNVTSTRTITATYDAKQCTLVFNEEGATTAGSYPNTTATYDSAMPSGNTAPSKTAYLFSGYWDGDNGTGNQYYTSSMTSYQNWNKNTESNTTLYAKWNGIWYTVSYNANGGSGAMLGSSHQYGVSKALSPNSYTKNGYLFGGWATSALGSAVYTDEEVVLNLTTTNDDIITLYATWNIETYDITYSGATANGNQTTFDILDLPLALIDPNIAENTPQAHYYTSGSSWDIDPITTTGDKTVTASFDETIESYNIYFDEVGGQSVTDITNTNYGASITLPTPAGKAGSAEYTYSFEGWFDETTIAAPIQYNMSTSIGNSAKSWTGGHAEYTSTFNAPSDYIQIQVQITASSSCTIWFENKNGDRTYLVQNYTGSITPTNYNITNATATGNKIYVSAFNVTTPTMYYKYGPEQVTWGTMPDLGSNGASKTLYARWDDTRRSYDITWDPNGGTWSNASTTNQTVSEVYGHTPSPPYTISRSGYTFTSWSPSISTVTQTQTYTAQWEVDYAQVGSTIPAQDSGVWNTRNFLASSYKNKKVRFYFLHDTSGVADPDSFYADLQIDYIAVNTIGSSFDTPIYWNFNGGAESFERTASLTSSSVPETGWTTVTTNDGSPDHYWYRRTIATPSSNTGALTPVYGSGFVYTEASSRTVGEYYFWLRSPEIWLPDYTNYLVVRMAQDGQYCGAFKVYVEVIDTVSGTTTTPTMTGACYTYLGQREIRWTAKQEDTSPAWLFAEWNDSTPDQLVQESDDNSLYRSLLSENTVENYTERPVFASSTYYFYAKAQVPGESLSNARSISVSTSFCPSI